MSLCAIIPVSNLAAANASLEAAGFGPRNFSVPAYGAGAGGCAATGGAAPSGGVAGVAFDVAPNAGTDGRGNGGSGASGTGAGATSGAGGKGVFIIGYWMEAA